MGVSLDGFIAGPDGEIEWSEPDEKLHRLVSGDWDRAHARLAERVAALS